MADKAAAAKKTAAKTAGDAGASPVTKAATAVKPAAKTAAPAKAGAPGGAPPVKAAPAAKPGSAVAGSTKPVAAKGGKGTASVGKGDGSGKAGAQKKKAIEPAEAANKEAVSYLEEYEQPADPWAVHAPRLPEHAVSILYGAGAMTRKVALDNRDPRPGRANNDYLSHRTRLSHRTYPLSPQHPAARLSQIPSCLETWLGGRDIIIGSLCLFLQIIMSLPPKKSKSLPPRQETTDDGRVNNKYKMGCALVCHSWLTILKLT